MIISASRRTDIPAHYAGWFFRRLQDGYVLVPNPMNRAQVRRVSLLPGDVDGIVFWSKNPAPMLARLGELAQYRYYFQFTLTPYGPDIEPGLPDKALLADIFRRLADAIGPDRIIWRYDPILINPAYPADRHIELFSQMAQALQGCTDKCVISFIDRYKATEANAGPLALLETGEEEKIALARALARIASDRGMAMEACAEQIDLAAVGVGRARCVDAGLFNRLWGMDLPVKKDRSQRPACGCAPSADIGAYNTCPSGCLYCYANYSPKMIGRNRTMHNPDSQMLVGRPEE